MDSLKAFALPNSFKNYLLYTQHQKVVLFVCEVLILFP